MVAQIAQRRFSGAVLGSGLLVNRRLAHAGANHQTDNDQQAGKQEGDAPSPGDHGFLAQRQAQQKVHTVCAEEADGRAQVGEATVQGALVGGGVLGRDKRGARPLARKAQALAGAAHAQQQNGNGPEHVVAGQKTDAEGRDAHHQQGRHQGFLTTQTVAEVAEQKAAEGARQKAHREGDEGKQSGQKRVGLGNVGEEDKAEIARRRNGVAVVVVELDCGADHGCDHDLRRRIALYGRLSLIFLRTVSRIGKRARALDSLRRIVRHLPFLSFPRSPAALSQTQHPQYSNLPIIVLYPVYSTGTRHRHKALTFHPCAPESPARWSHFENGQ